MLRLWVLVALVHMVFPQDIRRPPSITKGPTTLLIYRDGEDIMLECEATGTPEPHFKWHRNGVPLTNMQNIASLKQGSIRIYDASPVNEGYYQCFASNQYGIAPSAVSFLQMARLGQEKYRMPVNMSVTAGRPVKLKCPPATCVPKATCTYMWSIADDIFNLMPLHTSGRVQIDENGTLNFAYVVEPDTLIYMCRVYNPKLDIIMVVGGSYRIKVTPGPEHFVQPGVMFSSEQSVVMLEKQDSSIRCFFGGYPTPSISWKKRNGTLPVGRYDVYNFNTELNLKRIEQSDEGEYICAGMNTMGITELTISIDVQAKPVFKKETDRPRDVNVTNGDAVTYHCAAYAEPEAKVTWLLNGIPLNPYYLPSNFHLSRDSKELSISDVCKQCPDGSSSLMVIQCNASNVHGYAYAEGYLNVLERTVIIKKPEERLVISLPHFTNVEFTVDAQSDHSTPVEYAWYKLTADDEVRIEHNPMSGVMLSKDRKSLLLRAANSTTAWLKHRGTYRCRASNGYSTDYADVLLQVEESTPVVPVAPSCTCSCSCKINGVDIDVQ